MPAQADYALQPLALFDLAALMAHCKVKVINAADLTPTEVEQLEVLQRIGDGASAYCEARIGERFKQRSYSVVRDGDNRNKLLRLPRPIRSVSSLTIDGVALGADEYVVSSEAGKITLKSRYFSAGVGNIAVELEAGYDFTDAAQAAAVADVVVAALDLAKSHYDEWNVGGITLSSLSIGPASAIIRPGLNPRVEKYLDAKRDVRG